MQPSLIGPVTDLLTIYADVQLAMRILSAKLVNPVEVMRKICTNPDLARCGDPERYRILRKVSLTLVRP